MRRLPRLMLLMLTAAAPAAAQQTTVQEPNQSIAVGAQWAAHTAWGGTPGVQVSWRRWFSPRLGLEIGGRRWSGRDDDELITSAAIGLGVLGRGTAGRLSLVGGIGPGLYIDSKQQTFGVHGLAGFEVRVSRHVSALAELRIEWRDLHFAESSSGYPAIGLRFAF